MAIPPIYRTFVSMGHLSIRLGIPVSWLEREASEGLIPSLNTGGEILFNVDAVEKELLSRTALPTDYSKDALVAALPGCGQVRE